MAKTTSETTKPSPASLSGTDSKTSKDQTLNQRSLFMTMAFNMSWQLAIVIIIPVIAGVKLDKVTGTTYLFTFIGLGLALFGSAAVMWRTMRVANSLPVPKSSAAQKRAIKKSYEEEDDD